MSRDVEVPVGVSDNAAAQGGHLPECPIGQHPTRFDSCICDRLRACEARVREEEQAAATLEIAHKTGEHYAYGRADALTQMLDAGNVMGQEFYAKGYAAGLDAATEAVAALAPTWSVTFYVSRPSNGEWIGCNGAHEQVDVLAAIAALKATP